jgi:GNAT superfamily N-acetyltransferase
VTTIAIAQSDEDIRRCFAVMRELRPHLNEAEFVPRVQRQIAAGYRLGFVEEDGAIRTVAGFRFLDNLASGKVLYVDDLVTDPSVRSKNYGQRMLDWLIAEARAHDCDTLELDSGVQRFGAHRFYLRNRMDITSHHFRLHLR